MECGGPILGMPPVLSPKTIWSFRQNKPSYIVRDLAGLVEPDIVYRSLLQRGVFKWLAVRRDLIKLKEAWKRRLNAIHHLWGMANGSRKAYLKGYRAALEHCRAEVRDLCHSERWRAPDTDRDAQRWLEKVR